MYCMPSLVNRYNIFPVAAPLTKYDFNIRLTALIIQRFSWAISKVVPLAGQLTGPRDLAKVLRLPGPHTSVTLFTSEVNLQ